MKLAVINFSGNVGKSTITRHLLAPRLPGARVIAVESINADEGQEQSLRGFQFGELQEYLQAVDDVVGLDELSRLSQQLGVPQQEVADGLAQILPEVVNQLTPQGEVSGDADDVLRDGMAELQALMGRLHAR